MKTPLNRKILVAVLSGLGTAIGDVSVQLIQHGTADLPKSVLVGIIGGGLVRLIGAVVGALTTEG